MADYSNTFRERLPEQTEICARKALEWLQKDLQGEQSLTPAEIYHLANASHILLMMRDQYGKK